MTKQQPDSQEDLTTLKFAVKAMGIILVFGTIALFIAVYIKFGSSSPAETNTASKTKEEIVSKIPSKDVKKQDNYQQHNQTSCNFIENANITLEGNIINSIVNGNYLTIITAATPQKAVINKVQQGNSLTLTAKPYSSKLKQIIIFDLCSGKTISKIKVLNNK